MTQKASIFTLGCRTNQYDGQIIAKALMDAGYEIVPFDETADLYIINTCTVTHRGDADSRKAARNALRRNPDAFIVIAGCYPQWANEELKQIKGIDLIIGNREKFDILRYIPASLSKREKPEIIISDPTFENAFGEDVAIQIERSRAVLKIEDGCDRACSYCIVPKVRGKPRSLPLNEVLSRTGELLAIGYNEIVLTGVNLGRWGVDRGEELQSLLKSFDNLDGEFRIRLSSLEPMELDDEIVNTILQSTRIARHLHIPLQNTNERILKLMGRPDTLKKTALLLEKIKSFDTGWNIGTDLITGFPGETDDDFKEGFNNLLALPIDYFHIFTYSPRTWTSACESAENVAQYQVKMRLQKLKNLDKERRLRFLESQIGKSIMFIMEKRSDQEGDINYGLSDNYIRASFANKPRKSRGFIKAHLEKIINQTPVAFPD